MAFPADYTLLGKLSTNTALISGTHTGLPLAITEAAFNNGDNITSTVFGNTDNGGGDVRLSADAAGATQLPLEIVEWDTVGETCVIHTPRDVNGTTSVDIYIWGDNTGDTQPAVTDTYGRNAVWSAFHGAWHLADNSGTDSSGNANLASASTTDTTGKVGTAQSFSSHTFVGTTAAFTGANRSLSLWMNPGNTNVSQYLSTFVVGGTGNYWAIIKGFQSGFANVFDGGYITGTANDTRMPITASAWQKLDVTTDGTTTKGYIDGVEEFSVTASIRDVTGTPTLRIGSSAAGTNAYGGGMQYYQTIAEEKSANRITTEYNNFNSPATFFTSEAIAAGINVTGTTPSYSYTAVNATVDLTGEVTVTGATPSYSYTAVNGVVDLTAEITVTGATPTYSYTAVNGVIELGQEINVVGATPSYSYTAVQGSVLLQGEIAITGQTPNYSYTAVSASVQVGELDFAVNFSGLIKQSTFEGSIKSLEFNGTVKSATFSGNIKQSNFSGVRK